MSILELRDVSKCYLVHDSPLSSLVGLVAPKMTDPREVWALRDVSLAVDSGECLGIIGNNGSGKSTLLKVIGGIVTPTHGSVEVEGRISTLLDLTVGMQRELTGRDNIGIIGGLLGMTAAEIEERTDAIIAFAELDEAIGRPVKTYSTGMMMRLGFAIALHVDFDIFLVDEVLAVGDANFHRKCICRMRELHDKEQRTILIASHGLGEISSLTDRVVFLKEGRVVREGDTEEVLAAYWRECERERNRVGHRVDVLNPVNPYGEDLGDIKIEEVRFLDGDGRERERFATGEPMTIEICYDARRPVRNPLFRVQMFRNDGVWVHGMNTYRHGCDLGRVSGRGRIQLSYGAVHLLEADYLVSVGAWPDEYKSFITNVAYDYHEKAYCFRITSRRGQGAGIVYQPARWQHVEGEAAGGATGSAERAAGGEGGGEPGGSSPGERTVAGAGGSEGRS